MSAFIATGFGLLWVAWMTIDAMQSEHVNLLSWDRLATTAAMWMVFVLANVITVLATKKIFRD